MFTGLVADVGRIDKITRHADSVIFTVAPRVIRAGELARGESIAVDGVCLTVTERGAETFTVLAGAETLARTNLGDRREGDELNLERAMAMGDRLGGHIVQGHVDGIAELSERSDEGANLVLTIRPEPQLLRYVIEKGSIAVSGVSLTVNRVDEAQFSVALIPHTALHTNLGARRPGDRLNIEVDIIGKYVEKLVGAHT